MKEKETKLKCLESQGSTKSASHFQGFACAGRKIVLHIHTSELLEPASQSTEPQLSHYMVVTAHLNTLITHGLLGSKFPECKGDRHLSMSPVSWAQISRKRQEKFNNQFTTKHWEAMHQRHWQMAAPFRQRTTRSHMQVKLCCEQTAKASYGQGLSTEKPGKQTTDPYLSW